MLEVATNWLQENLFRVEICGGIAAGKTTLATLLSESGVIPVYENFQKNPFLELFYSDVNKYSFETEVTFLLQHYSQIKENLEKRSLLVSDYSFYLDYAYASITLSQSHNQAFRVVYNEVIQELREPYLLIYLRCKPETELRRIRNRNRSVEQSINIGFLERLNQSIECQVKLVSPSVKVLEINSDELDFAANLETRELVAAFTAGELEDCSLKLFPPI